MRNKQCKECNLYNSLGCPYAGYDWKENEECDEFRPLEYDEESIDGFYENETVKKAIDEFAKALIEEFTESASSQEFQQTRKILEDVCPMKVNKIKRKFLEKLGD